MIDTSIEIQKISTLKQFYRLMDQTVDVRRLIVEKILKVEKVEQKDIKSLKNALASIENIPVNNGLKILSIDNSEKIEARLFYEIEELQKDIIYLEKGEKGLIRYLNKLHPDFLDYITKGVEKLDGLHFNCFITDRDGTINNYCGRYRSSVQPIYNSVCLTRFANSMTSNPIIITSAPLEKPGIVDVSVNPDRTFIYAASKGREYINLDGKKGAYPINKAKQTILDKLNDRLCELVNEPAYEKFSLIGSGLQLKFGQTTLARQNIRKSISESESNELVRKIKSIVKDIDPEQKNFKIEDTGLDIEIILTIEDAQSGLKDFDKADAVKYLDKELNLGMAKGPHLICGDTSSDVPMIKASMEKTGDTWAVFVTKDADLAEKVRTICPNTLIIPEPDMLVGILGSMSKDTVFHKRS